MKNKLLEEHEHFMAIQPIRGSDGSGYDRGSLFTISPPWASSERDSEFTAKHYLSVIDISWIGTDKEYHPDVYPYNHDVFKLFNTIKDERNWFIRLCDHDLDYDLKKLQAKCNKCKCVFLVERIGKGAYTCNSYAQEALAFRSQFGQSIEYETHT